jgi:hypothetical protein
VAGLTRDEYELAAKEIQAAWNRAHDRDAGFRVIVEYGRKYGYKNVIAAIQGRVPKQFEREKPLSEWVDEQRDVEASAE